MGDSVNLGIFLYSSSPPWSVSYRLLFFSLGSSQGCKLGGHHSSRLVSFLSQGSQALIAKSCVFIFVTSLASFWFHCFFSFFLWLVCLVSLFQFLVD